MLLVSSSVKYGITALRKALSISVFMRACSRWQSAVWRSIRFETRCTALDTYWARPTSEPLTALLASRARMPAVRATSALIISKLTVIPAADAVAITAAAIRTTRPCQAARGLPAIKGRLPFGQGFSGYKCSMRLGGYFSTRKLDEFRGLSRERRRTSDLL